MARSRARAPLTCSPQSAKPLLNVRLMLPLSYLADTGLRMVARKRADTKKWCSHSCYMGIARGESEQPRLRTSVPTKAPLAYWPLGNISCARSIR